MINNRYKVHDYYFIKRLWEILDSEEQDQAIILSEFVWEKYSQDDERLNQATLKILSSKGILYLDDGLWKFKLPEMVYFSFSFKHIDLGNLQSLQALEILESLSSNIQKDSIHSSDEMLALDTFVFAHLINIYQRDDLLNKIISEDIPEYIFWVIIHLLHQVIPVLDVNISFLCKFLITLSKKLRGDLTISNIYSATNKLGELRPEYAIQIVKSFAENVVPEAGTYLEQLMTGIANSSKDQLSEIVEICIKWLDDEEEILCQSSVLCLQNLVIKEKFDQDRFINICNSLKNSPQDGVRFVLSSVLTRLGGKFPKMESQCFEMLSELVDNGPSEGIKFSIANVLSTSDETNFKILCLPFFN